jgi:alpha-L-rhamnosidase
MRFVTCAFGLALVSALAPGALAQDAFLQACMKTTPQQMCECISSKLPADKRQAASSQFANAIERKNHHLATGFIGTPRLLPGLSLAHRTDLAYQLLLTDTFPSWLFQVKLGATTMWERWDGWTPEKGFQDPGMNSFNHYAFGSVGEWIYRTMCGIDTDGPAFKNIVLKPQLGEGLNFAKASYDSIRGRDASEWKRDGDALALRFTVPPNTTATAYLPARDVASITESGKLASEAEGVKFLWTEDGRTVYRLQSGTYDFVGPGLKTGFVGVVKNGC